MIYSCALQKAHFMFNKNADQAVSTFCSLSFSASLLLSASGTELKAAFLSTYFLLVNRRKKHLIFRHQV
jgi:hypothetical protein